MLVLSRVSKHYGDTQALAPTDLQVPVGETLVLIGPSGCGKSTLLRLITCPSRIFMQPSEDRHGEGR